jgi:murein tripeptide amidase MpaA
MNDFLSVNQIEWALGALNEAYPSLTRLIPMPNETESESPRRSTALLIRGNPKFDCRPGLIFISGVHAREWGGPDILVNLGADLLEAYTTNVGLEYGGATFSADMIRAIVDRTDIIVFPLVNPDGYAYSRAAPEQTDQSCWRKNRNPENSGGDSSKIGVDVNRNYGFLWDFTEAFAPGVDPASTNPADGRFHGKGPFSEAESRNVQWLVDNCPNARYFVDVHSFHGKILYPWGDDESQSTDSKMAFWNHQHDHKRGKRGDTEYREFMHKARLEELRAAGLAIHDGIHRVRGEDYLVGDGFSLLYAVSGGSKDWAFSREFVNTRLRELDSFVIEFNKNHDFFPEWDEMEDLIRDINSGLIALCVHARPGAIAVIQCWLGRFVRIAIDTLAGFFRR